MLRQFLFITALLFLTIQSHAFNAQVVDGDTLKIGNTTHRLNGIDAPEEGQKCKGTTKKDWPCGKRSTDELARLLNLGEVSCVSTGSDGYGREISTCRVGDIELNSHLVRRGFAWAFRKYSQAYVREEELAKEESLGIWVRPTKPAWEFREERWNSAAQEAPDGCPIKGNISRNGRIYHAPWSPWYKRTKINLKRGERWFCDEAEAIAAGWRAPIWR